MENQTPLRLVTIHYQNVKEKAFEAVSDLNQDQSIARPRNLLPLTHFKSKISCISFSFHCHHYGFSFNKHKNALEGQCIINDLL